MHEFLAVEKDSAKQYFRRGSQEVLVCFRFQAGVRSGEINAGKKDRKVKKAQEESARGSSEDAVQALMNGDGSKHDQIREHGVRDFMVFGHLVLAGTFAVSVRES